MSGFQPGEIVDITIKGIRIKSAHENYFSFIVGAGQASRELGLLTTMSEVTVERVAPADWPPQPGDEWTGPEGERWFAMKYYGDFDRPSDYEGCNSDGWRVVLMPLEIGPYGGTEQRPDDALRARGPLTLVHREEASAS